MSTRIPQVPIGDVVTSVRSWDPTRSPTNDLIRYVDISSVDRERKVVTTPVVVPAHEAPSRARQIVSANDVLVSTVRPNLNAAALVTGEHDGATASTGFTVLRPVPSRIVPQFLFYWATSPMFVTDMVKKATGASYPAVSDKIIKDSMIPLPTLSEQKRIAGILDQADGLRRKRQQALALTDQFLRSTFLDLFGDPVTNPKRWPIHKLGDHLTFLTTGSRGWAEHYSDSGARFIRSLDVQMNFISDDDVAWVNAPPGTEADRTRVRPDDVLLTVTGSKIGRVAPVPSDIAEAYISQHVALMRLDGSLRPRFLSMFLSDLRGGQQQIRRMQYGQTKPGLNLEQLRAFRIPCPPLSVQDNFLAQWDQLRCCHRRLEMSSLQSEALFNSLVQRAFRGEL